MGGHGLPVVADTSPESRSPCACAQLLPTPAAYPYGPQAHLGSRTRDPRAGLGPGGGCRLSVRLQNRREGHWLMARGNQPDAGHRAEGVSRASRCLRSGSLGCQVTPGQGPGPLRALRTWPGLSQLSGPHGLSLVSGWVGPSCTTPASTENWSKHPHTGRSILPSQRSARQEEWRQRLV